MYLAKRGIVRPGARNLVPEFQNPLFLKSCCDFLKKEGKKRNPTRTTRRQRDLRLYNGAVVRTVTKRMKLHTDLDRVSRALRRFEALLVSREEEYVAQIRDYFHLRSSGRSLERCLLSPLEGERVLAIELVRQDDGTIDQMVRCTFWRHGDHAIAERLLCASRMGGISSDDAVISPTFDVCGSVYDRLARFNPGWGRRWVCMRAHELG